MLACFELAKFSVSRARFVAEKVTDVDRPFRVKNTKREDIVFICFQIWVLGMSIVALLNESIPHM